MQNDDPSTRVSAPPPVLVGPVSGVQAPISVVLWSSLRPPAAPPVGGSATGRAYPPRLPVVPRTAQSVVLPTSRTPS